MAGLTNLPAAFDSPPLTHYGPDPVLWGILQTNFAADMSDAGAGLPNVLAQTIPDYAATSSLTATAGTIFLSRIWTPPNTTITKISIINAVTAVSTPTNWWFFYCTSAGVIKAISADQLTTALAADTIATLSMATPYLDQVGGFNYLGIMFAGTTGPTVAAGVTLGTHGRGAVKSTTTLNVLAASCDTGKTTPPAVGATLGTLPLGSASVAPFLGYVS